MAFVAQRLIKGVVAGSAVGADEMGRCLTESQRSAMVLRLTEDVEQRAALLVADARAAAVAIMSEAEAQADAVRARARGEGYAAGFETGQHAALRELAPLAALLRQAADEAGEIRRALLEDVEIQAVRIALDAARRVVGTAAETQAGLAAQLVRDGLRRAAHRIVRIRVHANDVAEVITMLADEGTGLVVSADDNVEIGGCILDVEGGTVDLRLGVQLDIITRSVLPEGEEAA